MFESFLLFGCILFLIVLVYSFQMRQRLHTKYATSCDVTYYPKKESIYTPSTPSSPSPSSPINYRDLVSSPDFESLEWYGY